MANIVRTRPGRALQAIRDRDIAAEVIGVRVARNKIIVFALSSALAGMAGGLDAVRTRFLTPGVAEAELLESIRYVAVIVVGGIGTVTGAIVGALFLGPLPELIEQYSETINFTVPILDQPLLKDVRHQRRHHDDGGALRDPVRRPAGRVPDVPAARAGRHVRQRPPVACSEAPRDAPTNRPRRPTDFLRGTDAGDRVRPTRTDDGSVTRRESP